ncbi:hypothetical protein ILUMI_06800 [Ignelater luminosus]|uniref:Uncharacterized protein n=1 Tax=Ignelater luminosus TaxID=2038154 RepID=A0A8K0D7Q3_IGNLU|nr:hypothetical protein ILUMI_06800 [Ignelater luminosus]
MGKFGRVIRLLERRLNKPLQFTACLLHMNELPLRPLFLELDGTTTGPTTYSGFIGKLLDDCKKCSIVSLEKIECILPDISEIKYLSSDQHYLYDIISTVISGECPPDLANRSLEKMSHATYVLTNEPIYKLKQLATFVVKHNAFFAHSENLLVFMLSDEQKHVRELAARRILKAKDTPKSGQLRVVEVPKINLNASSYIDLIEWQQQYSQPPILYDISNETLHSLVESGGNDEVLLLRLSYYTQAVVRAVKTVTEASLQLCDKKIKISFD